MNNETHICELRGEGRKDDHPSFNIIYSSLSSSHVIVHKPRNHK